MEPVTDLLTKACPPTHGRVQKVTLTSRIEPDKSLNEPEAGNGPAGPERRTATICCPSTAKNRLTAWDFPARRGGQAIIITEVSTCSEDINTTTPNWLSSGMETTAGRATDSK